MRRYLYIVLSRVGTEESVGLAVKSKDSGLRNSNCISTFVSLSKIYQLLKVLINTQEVLIPSQHD